MILNFLIRMVFGAIGIYTCNSLLGALGVAVYAGLNLVNLLAVGILGISGFGLVFAIAAFSLL